MVLAALGPNASARARNRIRQARKSLEGVCFYNCVGLAGHVPLLRTATTVAPKPPPRYEELMYEFRDRTGLPAISH